MPKLSDPRITKGHAASFLIRLYLHEPEFLKELYQLRQNYLELLTKLAVAQVKFFANCRVTLADEEYYGMVHNLHELFAGGGGDPSLPRSLTRQLKAIKQMYQKLVPYFRCLERLASDWKLRASWAGPMLYLYDIHDFLKRTGMPDSIDVPLDQLDLLYPFPPPLAPLEIKVSAWAFVLDGRKKIQAEITRELRDYERQLKTMGLKEKPSALETHARWWFEHYVHGKTYPELEREFHDVFQESIRRKV